MTTPSVIHQQLKLLRIEKNLTQSDVAERLGISRPTYTLIEKGLKDLTLGQLYALVALFEVEPSTFLPTATMGKQAPADYDKFKELILKCLMFGADSSGRITKTKLARLVYLADFAWYYLHKQPMTGTMYRCTAKGPIADDYFRAVDELYEDQAIAIEPRGTALMISAIEQQPAKRLGQDELELVQRICIQWHSQSTEAIVDFTRQQAPCKHSRLGDLISYQLILREQHDRLF